ncbi:hypothetical protein AAIB41_13945 [Brucella sp. BE17]|uniref:hypothetical protein n=1 Tax=Brucella sp. BE17 TaxID=3142977 RepID=UPI0031BB4190
MIKIYFSPQLRNEALTVEKTNGDRLRINGELFNFNPLNDGDVIPAGSVPCDWIVGPVENKAGVIHLTLILPYRRSRMGVETPEPITAEDDGEVKLPSIDEEEIANVDA